MISLTNLLLTGLPRSQKQEDNLCTIFKINVCIERVSNATEERKMSASHDGTGETK